MSDKYMTDEELLGVFRHVLIDGNTPNGKVNGTVSVLHLDDARYMKPDFICQCIDEIEMALRLKESLTPTQKLAVHVFMDSCYLGDDLSPSDWRYTAKENV